MFEVPLHHDTLLRYFTGSLFYDLKCNNERVMGRVQELGSMTGVEYVEVETAHGGAHLMAVERRLRSGPNQTDTEAAYYMLEGTIYQAPDLKTLLQSRMVGAVAGCLLSIFQAMIAGLPPFYEYVASQIRQMRL